MYKKINKSITKAIIKWSIIILWPFLLLSTELNKTFISKHSTPLYDLLVPFYKSNIKSKFQKLDTNQIINLKITKKNIIKDRELMDSFIEIGFQRDRMKKWREGEIQINGVFEEIKYKLHGTTINVDEFKHNDKISKKIKFKTQNINDIRRLNLIIGEEMNPTVILPNQLAYEMGLISSFGEMKIVKVNGKSQGAYYVVEHIDKNYLKREYGINEYTKLKNHCDWGRKEYPTSRGHGSDHDLYFGNIEIKGNAKNPEKALGHFKTMISNMKKDNYNKFIDFFDEDYMAKYLALALLFNDSHFMTGDNLKLIWDYKKNVFYPIYRAETGGMAPLDRDNFQDLNFKLFDTFTSSTSLERVTHKIFIYLLSNQHFRKKRDYYLYKLIKEREVINDKRDKIVKENENVMNKSDLDLYEYRQSYFNVRYEILDPMIELTEKYFSYQKIFITNDKVNKKLYVRSDTYSEIDLYLDSNVRVIIPPIQFNKDKKWYYIDNLISYDSTKEINRNSFIAVNSLTKDTLKFEELIYNEIEIQSQLP